MIRAVFEFSQDENVGIIWFCCYWLQVPGKSLISPAGAAILCQPGEAIEGEDDIEGTRRPSRGPAFSLMLTTEFVERWLYMLVSVIKSGLRLIPERTCLPGGTVCRRYVLVSLLYMDAAIKELPLLSPIALFD